MAPFFRLKMLLYIVLLVIAFAIYISFVMYAPQNYHIGIDVSTSIMPYSSDECRPGKPCEIYADDVDFRVIVITYNRAASLSKLLQTIDSLELDGDRAALEIWIDVNSRGESHKETVQIARSFQWKGGPTRVHVQPSHAGIASQWIDTWRPRPDSPEIGLILEDDMSVSPMAYRWLKAVHRAMANRTDVVGATLASDKVKTLSHRPKGPVAASKSDTVVLYKCLGTWGFSPKAEYWRRFQDWYHQHKPSVSPRFRPYVPDTITTSWFKEFERQGKQQSMWEMYFIYFMHAEQLYCVYSNLAVYNGNTRSCLSINRREVGLHYHRKGREDFCTLLTDWRDDFVTFPTNVVRLHWDGSPMGTRLY